MNICYLFTSCLNFISGNKANSVTNYNSSILIHFHHWDIKPKNPSIIRKSDSTESHHTVLWPEPYLLSVEYQYQHPEFEARHTHFLHKASEVYKEKLNIVTYQRVVKNIKNSWLQTQLNFDFSLLLITTLEVHISPKLKLGKYVGKLPIGDDEKRIVIRGFNIQSVIVVEEASEQFIDEQTTDDLCPHAYPNFERNPGLFFLQSEMKNTRIDVIICKRNLVTVSAITSEKIRKMTRNAVCEYH